MNPASVREECPILNRTLEPEPVPLADEAAEYDALVCRHAWLLNRPFVKTVERIGLVTGRVLDIGTGPGWIPIELARRHPNWSICALDPSEAMLKRARRNADEANIVSRIQFTPGCATDLPFADGQFDLVISHFTLHHVDDPLAMLDEAARVVRPGGQVIIKDLVRQPPWKANLRLAFERYVLSSSPAQVAMSRASIQAALSLAEARALVRRSRLEAGRVRGCLGPYFIIAGQGK